MGTDIEKYEEDKKAANAFQEKYPKLFIKRGKPMHSMNGGLGIGKGWYPLLEEVCQILETYRDKCPDIHFLQIKEKFARLTTYIGFNKAPVELCREIYDKIEEVCEKSLKTCENCGTKETVTTSAFGGYWMRTLCESCSSKIGGKESDFEAARKVLDMLKEESKE